MMIERLYLTVLDEKRSLEGIEALLEEVSASGGYSRGDVRLNGRPARWSSWKKTLSIPGDLHGGLDGIDYALSGLSDQLGERLGMLATDGASVLLMVVQDLDEGEDAPNIMISAASIKWMASAGASLTIEQPTDRFFDWEAVTLGQGPDDLKG